MSSIELLTRAVTQVTPKKLAEEKLLSGKPMRIYLGIDPTGIKLHLGHSVPLRKLRAFQDAGHHVIFLIGSFTAMIGDPSGRDTQREPLSKKDVLKNFETYKEQASKILDFSKTEVVYNHEWLEKLDFPQIINIASNFTVQQMMERDMFEKRWEQGSPIGVHEFFYPLMVGYDSVMLDVDCELGGNDQYFNMLAGRTLQKAFGKREKFVLTTKLIEGTDGRKMSKTYDNCIWLEDEPNDMYGKILSIKDELIFTYFECCTDVPLKEIQQMEKDMKKGSNPKELKMRLAREIVTQLHSAEAAESAEKNFQNVFADKGVPEDIQEVTAGKGSLILEIMAEYKLVASKSEGRRLIEQGGVKMNERTVKTIDEQAEEGILKVGKRKFLKILFK
jgi:tyrosyl-tRNA synthetase